MYGTSRSYLFVPANRPDRFEKALAAGADAVVIDMEDAVPRQSKDDARAALGAWLASEHPVVLRINAADSPWFRKDLALCTRPGVRAVMLPKVQHTDELAEISRVNARLDLLPLIETAAGFDNLRAIAGANRVQRLAFGSLDLQLDLDMSGGHQELLFFRSQFVLVSRLAGIAPPVDGISTAIHERDELVADAQHARNLGFGGKLCIHPAQVEIVNRTFSPDEAELTWARSVLDAIDQSAGAAVAVQGRMVDRPVIERARRILRRHMISNARGPR